ncbi:MAG: trypsin-like peptidase domain-containing protein [Burkholderiaceae bacterium]|jgi:2-alkenal reductase|nr:trypsin-like peptidase domain-containing protein [Burkholderiaceae bacterium]
MNADFRLRQGSIRAWMIALLAVLAAGVGLAAFAQSAARPEPRPVVPRGPLLAHEQQLVSLFESTAPSVAYITTEQLRATGFFTAEVAQGAGSGFVWDTQGHVVTNNHVIAGARRVFVQLDAGDPIEAEPVGFAPQYDLAVVRLKRAPTNLKPIPLGTSKDLKIGQTVIAIGNPFGLQRTLTQGIISAIDRELPTAGFREVAGVIQTDAAINPGNSGGPLVDSAGRLIGVNTAIRSASGSSAGVGFAIPVDLVNRIVPSLIARGRAPLPGIGIDPYPPESVARAGIRGVVIRSVGRGSPAAQAGLRAANPQSRDLGDVIVAVNGRRIETVSQFSLELDRVGIDNTVELTVVRDERERKVKVRVIDLQQ